MAVLDNLTGINIEEDSSTTSNSGRRNSNESRSAQSTEEHDDNEAAEEELRKKWTPDDIQALLIKAISYKAPARDITTVIQCGADVNKPMTNGLHPLHYAAHSNNAKCIELLLNAGANVNATDDIGYTPLHLAARCGHKDCIQVLIDNGAIINFNEPGTVIRHTDQRNKLGFTTTEPLNLAIQNYHSACVTLLIENGARYDNKYFMGDEICLAPLDDVSCLEVLLQYGANPNVFNRCGLSPLMKACKGHHIDAVRLLLKYRADINAQSPPLFEQKSVLQFAIQSGNIVILNLLLGKNVKISRNSDYKYGAIHTAVLKGRADIVRLLLQYKADPNEPTDEGVTPLILACGTPGIREREAIVRMLIDCGADVNSYAPGYCYLDPYLSPLTEFLKNIGSDEGFNVVKLLINHGAIVHFTAGEMGMHLRKNPFSVLPYAHTMQQDFDIFELTVNVASKYSPLAIHACETLPEDMKDYLLFVAVKPRELKHIARMSIRHWLSLNLLDKIPKLPLPALLQSYLLLQ